MPAETIGAVALVERIRAGDRAAESSLVERYGRGVVLVLRSRVGRGDLAEDLYQETFRLGLEKIRGGELRQPERLPAFLGGVARNLARDHLRRSRRRAEADEEEIVLTLPDPSPGPLGLLMRHERAAVVRALLQELPTERDREVLIRVYLRGEERNAICRDLDLEPAHLSRVLFRARQRYRALYEQRLSVGVESKK